ncbi:hypothetical protein ACVR05_00845 [Streptococcus caprae]|uniref:Uncharacterized protein n=1 Tax=Streptococcus caprae TaxID=1640501 RepID=A0ABV8CTP9_9STRE
MTKEEILNLLAEKRKLTAPVAVASKNLNQAQLVYNNAKKFLQWLINSLLIWAILVLIVNVIDSWGNPMKSAIWFILAGGIYFARLKLKIEPAKLVLDEAQYAYNVAVNDPDYIAGAQGFPQKFYNYHDIYRLYQLISEGRAMTLPEAYNLLESQQFQETQLSIQEETRALQADIANSSRVTATASTITAFNTFMNRKK